MAVKYTSNMNNIIIETEVNMPIAIRFFLEDMKDIAEPLTPMLEGDLRSSTTVSVAGKQGSLTWGEEYASYQDRGQRMDGTHIVKRYTTPGTGKDFSLQAAKQAFAKSEEYLRKARVIR